VQKRLEPLRRHYDRGFLLPRKRLDSHRGRRERTDRDRCADRVEHVQTTKIVTVTDSARSVSTPRRNAHKNAIVPSNTPNKSASAHFASYHPHYVSDSDLAECLRTNDGRDSLSTSIPARANQQSHHPRELEPVFDRFATQKIATASRDSCAGYRDAIWSRARGRARALRSDLSNVHCKSHDLSSCIAHDPRSTHRA